MASTSYVNSMSILLCFFALVSCSDSGLSRDSLKTNIPEGCDALQLRDVLLSVERSEFSKLAKYVHFPMQLNKHDGRVEVLNADMFNSQVVPILDKLPKSELINDDGTLALTCTWRGIKIGRQGEIWLVLVEGVRGESTAYVQTVNEFFELPNK